MAATPEPVSAEDIANCLALLGASGDGRIRFADFRHVIRGLGVADTDLDAFLAMMPPGVAHPNGGLRLGALTEFITGSGGEQWRRTCQEAYTPPQASTGNDASHAWAFQGWLDSLGFNKQLAECIATHVCPDNRVDEGFMLAFLRSMPQNLDTMEDLLTRCGAVRVLAEALVQGGRDLVEAGAATGQELNSKFLQQTSNFEMSYSSISDFYGGLEKLNGSPDPQLMRAMEKEHTRMKDSQLEWTTGNYGVSTDSEREWAFATGGPMPSGGWPIETMNCEHPREAKSREWLQEELEKVNAKLREANETPLLEEEAIGLRLYTGPMFERYNNRLRAVALKRKYDRLKENVEQLSQGASTTGATETAELQSKRQQLSKLELALRRFKWVFDNENSYTTTIQVINSGLIKLGKVQKVEKVFRGISGGVLPPEFWEENEWKVCGGVENGFLSTTTDRKVAMNYAANDPNKAGTVLEVQMSMVDRGANLQWISQYPGEAELCFPPLTGLQVLSTRVEKSVLVVEARLSVNLVSLTIEEVVAKRYNMVKHLCGDLCDEVAFAIMKADGDWKPVQEALFSADDTQAALWEASVKKLLKAMSARMAEQVTNQEPESMNDNEKFLEAVQAALGIKRDFGRPTCASVVCFLHPAISELGSAQKGILEVALLNTSEWPVLAELGLLDLSGSAVADDSVKELTERCPKVKEVKLNGCKQITDVAAEHLVRNCPDLGKVVLGGCAGMTEKGVRCLQQAGVLTYACVTKEDVLALRGALSRASGEADAASSFRAAVEFLARTSADLLQVDFAESHDLTDQDVKCLAAGCGKMQQVQFAGCSHLTDEGLGFLADGCKDLQQVNFGSCCGLTDQGVQRLAEKCKGLQNANFESCSWLTDTGVRYLAEGCPNLQDVNLCVCDGLTNQGLKYLAKGCPNLLRFNLYSCRNLTDDGLKYLAEGCPKIQNADLAYYGRLTDQGVKHLAEGCPDLQGVSLGGASNVTDQGLKYLADHCRNLQSADLYNCGSLTDQALKHLAQGCPNLQFVSFYCCANLTDQGVKDLAEGCQSLKRVDFQGCMKVTVPAIEYLREKVPGIIVKGTYGQVYSS